MRAAYALFDLCALWFIGMGIMAVHYAVVEPPAPWLLLRR